MFSAIFSKRIEIRMTSFQASVKVKQEQECFEGNLVPIKQEKIQDEEVFANVKQEINPHGTAQPINPESKDNEEVFTNVKQEINPHGTAQPINLESKDNEDALAKQNELHNLQRIGSQMIAVGSKKKAKWLRKEERRLILNSSDKQFACQGCEKKFPQSKDLSNHEKCCTLTKSSTCKICGDIFALSCALKLHRKKCHSKGTIVRDSFKCNTCNEIFPTMDKVKKHQVSHTSKSSVCKICQKALSDPVKLAQHAMNHAVIKPFTCKICQEGFWNETDWENHIVKHAGGSPFICEVCKESFAKISYLSKHMKIHPRETILGCKICKKKFAQSTYLKNHYASHVGIQLKRCEQLANEKRKKSSK